MVLFEPEEQRVLLLALGLFLAASGAQLFSHADHRAAAAPKEAPASASPTSAPEDRLDPNSAPPEDLSRLPGMTSTLLAAVVKYRAERIFLTPADLASLPGVAAHDVDAVAGKLAFPGENALRPRPGGGRLDINEASEEDLQKLPGIGTATARAIVERRTRRRFGDLEELLALPGIGPQKLERLQPVLRAGSGGGR
ncbi:MAG: helix-hairpin-helix domain-containing protein [Candidatus Wallbacteria bacterium]|nr:helix-hairpin-helix domain-containing protein [Candidatus Wallbacteria bacterium]